MRLIEYVVMLVIGHGGKPKGKQKGTEPGGKSVHPKPHASRGVALGLGRTSRNVFTSYKKCRRIVSLFSENVSLHKINVIGNAVQHGKPSLVGSAQIFITFRKNIYET